MSMLLKSKLSTKYFKVFKDKSVFSPRKSPIFCFLRSGVFLKKYTISFASESKVESLIYPIDFRYANPVFILALNFDAAVCKSFFFFKFDSISVFISVGICVYSKGFVCLLILSSEKDILEKLISLFNEFFCGGYVISHISKIDLTIESIVLRQILIKSLYS